MYKKARAYVQERWKLLGQEVLAFFYQPSHLFARC